MVKEVLWIAQRVLNLYYLNIYSFLYSLSFFLFFPLFFVIVVVIVVVVVGVHFLYSPCYFVQPVVLLRAVLSVDSVCSLTALDRLTVDSFAPGCTIFVAFTIFAE